MAPGSDRVAASIPHSYTALQLHSAVWWLRNACTFHTRPPSRSMVAEQVWDNKVLPNMRFPPSSAGQVEGLGARDAGSKTRSTLWPAHSCKGMRTSSMISLRVYILSRAATDVTDVDTPRIKIKCVTTAAKRSQHFRRNTSKPHDVRKVDRQWL